MTKKHARRQYSDDYKIQIIEDIAAKRLKSSDANKQGIYSSMLSRWRTQYEAGELKRSSAADSTTPVASTALVPSTPPSVEVIPAKRKYVRRAQAQALSPADETLRHNEMAFYVDRSCRKLYAAIRAGTVSLDEFTRGFVVDLLNARNAAQGGK